MTMRENMARALRDKAATFDDPVHFYVEQERRRRWEDAHPGLFYDDAGIDEDEALESWAILADAVLDAMRSVTDEIVKKAARDGSDALGRLAFKWAWQDMITAAKAGA